MPTRPFLRLVLSLAVLIATTGLAACADNAPETVADTPGTAASAPPSANANANAPANAPAATGPSGKYGCIQTVPRMVGGSYEYEIEQRGFINLADGRYTDPFQVAGTYRHDAATDSTFFTGGALDGANATPMENGRLWVVIPVEGGRENRWTCGPA